MLIKRRSTDEKLSIFICAYLLLNAINATLQDIFGLSGTRLEFVKIIVQIVLMLLLVSSIHRMKIKIFKVYITVYLLSVGVLIYSVLIGSSINQISSWATTILTVCIPLGVSAYCIKDKKILYTTMLKVSFCILIVDFVDMFGTNDDLYNMHFSYSVLFVLMIHLNKFMNEKKLLYLLLSIAEILMIAIYGSRGALVCVVFFIVLKVFTESMDIRRKMSYISVLAFISVIGYLSINNISLFVMNKLAFLGISSRTLGLLTSDNFFKHDSDRLLIWEKSVELIRMKPILGWGIGGFTESLGWPYPHNFFLDLFLAFGIILGGVFAAVIIWNVVTSIKSKDETEKNLSYIFVSIAFVCLLFSGTVFTNYYFYIMMGIIISANRNNNPIMP